MFSATTNLRSLLILPASAAIALSIVACSDGDKNKAQALYDNASSAIESAEYARAITLLDSIDSIYPKQVEIRRAGMHLRAKAIEGNTLNELQTNDSLTAAATLAAEEMKGRLAFVTNPVEGYYVATSQKDKAVEKTEGIHARMSPEGVFYIISSAPTGTMSTGVALSAGGDRAESASVAFDGERNDRSRGAETITFTQAECDTIGAFALTHSSQPITLTFTGGKNRSITLSSEQAAALAQVYAASRVYSQLRLLQLQKNMLEQQLTLSRSQQARTYGEPASK